MYDRIMSQSLEAESTPSNSPDINLELITSIGVALSAGSKQTSLRRSSMAPSIP